MADRVKIYEETKKKGLPVWAWLLLLLLILALLAYFFTRHATTPAPAAVAPVATSTPEAAASTLPNLGTVHFATNQATLTPEGEATLERAASGMKSNPALHLRLEGYTDSTGALPKNATLSQQRTATVANFLKSQGIDGSRLTGGGFGPNNPAASNATETGKADNRRVELFSQQ